MSTDYSMKIPADKAFGIIIGVITVLLPNFFCWSSSSASVFGPSPLLGLMALTGCGGGLMFSCLADKGKRVLGFIPGIVAGVGASGLAFIATKLFGSEPLKLELISTFVLLGGLPSIPLAVILRVITFKTPTSKS